MTEEKKSPNLINTDFSRQREPSQLEYIVNPYGVSTRLSKEARLDQQEELILFGLFDSLRYRLTIANFLIPAKGLTPKEKVGIVFFVGVTNIADDLLDSNPELSQMNNSEQLREKLLKNVVNIGNSIGITLDELLQLTLNKFSPQKQQHINEFLTEALTTQAQLGSSLPGNYTFGQALAYRRNTSNRYSEVGAELANISDGQKLQQAIDFGNLMQMIDDVADLITDYNEGAMNPVIGLANDENELQILRDVSPKDIPSNFILRMRFVRSRLKMMSETRRRYRELFSKELDKIPPGKQRMIAKMLGRLLL